MSNLLTTTNLLPVTNPGAANVDLQTVVEYAFHYRAQGWIPVPCHPRSKIPSHGEGWQNERPSLTDISALFSNGQNVGLLLGLPSGDLVDIDLDWPEAVRVAPFFLPQTPMRHGRPTKRLSHHWYVCHGATTEKYHDPDPPAGQTDKKKSMVVELRANGQTITPPSTHQETGEVVFWEEGELKPAHVSFDELRTAVGRVAAAAVLARRWPHLPRQDTVLALSGFLARAGIALQDAQNFVMAVVHAADDEEAAKRLDTVEHTYGRRSAGEKVTGGPRLTELVGEKVVTALSKWLGLSRTGHRDKAPTLRQQAGDDPLPLPVTKSDMDFENSGSDAFPADGFQKLSKQIDRVLSKRSNRRAKRRVARGIGQWLLDHDRLVVDVSRPQDPQPYLRTDEGAMVSLTPGSTLIRQVLTDLNVNASEAAFVWIINELRYRWARRGRQVCLARWSELRDGRLYISAGTSKLVVVDADGTLCVRPNGHDGVLFAATACFAEWTPAAAVEPRTLTVFQPQLETPDEVPAYTPEIQTALLQSVMVAILAHIKPMPLVTFIGQFGSGKSDYARAMVKLFHGPEHDISTAPGDAKDFSARQTNLRLNCLDNLDSRPDRWLPDLLAIASTGGTDQSRELYSNSNLHQAPWDAVILITTRTASFAEGRPDLVERVLPAFFGGLQDAAKVGSTELMEQVQAHRDGLLSWLAQQAARWLRSNVAARGLPGRFQEFAALALRDPDRPMTLPALTAWTSAQRLSVVELDEICQTLLDHFRNGGPRLVGRAEEILKALGKELSYQGGARRFARRLRESVRLLALCGISVTTGKHGGHGYFDIDMPLHGPSPPPPEPARPPEPHNG